MKKAEVSKRYARRCGHSGRRKAYIRRQVFPQAPSPTMTSLRRISAMLSRCTRQHDWPCLAEKEEVEEEIVRR